MASNIVPHRPRATSQLQLLYFCKGSSLLTAHNNLLLRWSTALQPIWNATRIAFKLIKHPISNGGVFGKTWLCLVLSTNESKQSSPARSCHFQEANICRLAVGKCVFILRLCHFHYPAAVYRSTGIGISATDSPNAIRNLKMLRRVMEWLLWRRERVPSSVWMGEGWGEEDERQAERRRTSEEGMW